MADCGKNADENVVTFDILDNSLWFQDNINAVEITNEDKEHLHEILHSIQAPSNADNNTETSDFEPEA